MERSPIAVHELLFIDGWYLVLRDIVAHIACVYYGATILQFEFILIAFQKIVLYDLQMQLGLRIVKKVGLKIASLTFLDLRTRYLELMWQSCHFQQL